MKKIITSIGVPVHLAAIPVVELLNKVYFLFEFCIADVCDVHVKISERPNQDTEIKMEPTETLP